MTTAYTSLLGLALPVTGELQGTWGDTVNNSITSLLDSAVAGTTTLSTDGDVTLTTTTGASNQARQAILLCSGARTAARNITAPAQSKIYTVINATTGGYAVTIRGAGPTTGVTIPAGQTAQVAWNGSDFVDASNYVGGNLKVNGNLTVSGATALNGNMTFGDASADTVTVNGTITSNLLFTDNTYDIGASNATRPKDLYLAGAVSAGGSVTLGGDLTVTRTSGTSLANIFAGSSGTAKLTLTSGTVYGYTLQTDSAGALKFIRDSTLYMYQTNTTEQWFNSSYIYSSAGGATGTVRSGIYMDGTNNQLLLYTNATARVTVGSTGNTYVTASNAVSHALSSTYALLIGNNSSAGDMAFGSDSTNSYIQSWGSRQLYLQNQGNPIRLGNNSVVGVNFDGAGSTAGAAMVVNYYTTRTAAEHALRLCFNDSMASGENVYMSFGQSGPSQLARIAGVYEGGSYMGSLKFYTNRNSDGASPQLSMTLDAAGRSLVPNQPSFMANGAGYNGQYFYNQKVGNFTSGNGGHNVGSNYSPIAGGGTGRFTAPVNGYYFFTAGCLWYGSGLTQPRTLDLRLNGSIVCNNYSDSAQSPITMTVSAVVYMNANEYMECWAGGTQAGWYGNGATAGSYDGSVYNFFAGRLLG